MGPLAERVLYAGAIQGYPPGTREGLVLVYNGEPPRAVYKVTLDSAERALKSELQSRAAEMRKTIQRFGEEGAQIVRAEWSAAIAELVVERRIGQRAEMFRRTTRVIEEWEAELIPAYVAQQVSLEEAVSGSGLEFEQRVQGWKHQELLKRKKQRKKQRAIDPVSSAHQGDVGPQETNAPGRRRTKSPPPPNQVMQDRRQQHTTSREPVPAVDIPALVERACAEREATLLAQFEGLMRKHMASQSISPVRSSSRRPATESRQEERTSDRRSRRVVALEAAPVSERESGRLEASARHPVLKRYYQSPYVNAALEYEEQERERASERSAARRRSSRRRGSSWSSRTSSNEDEDTRIPTTVKFKDRIKSFPKFSRPDGSFTWTDFLTQLIEILERYRVPAREWPAWLMDRLGGKAQSALLNLTVKQRSDWATLVSELNAYFHVEFEMRTAEEELLTRKQGPKESVRDFINQLMFLARKAFGQDIERREAAVLKRIELGLSSASLRRTFDDLIMLPGVTLSVINAELVKRESRDEPGRYHQFVAQEREAENSRKPQNGKAAKDPELAMSSNGGQEGQVNLAPAKPVGRGALRGGASVRGRGRGRGAGGRGEAGGTSAAVNGDQACWNCGSMEHWRTDCPTATEEEIASWKLQSGVQRSRRGRPYRRGTRQRGGGRGKPPTSKGPANQQPQEENSPDDNHESGN